MSSRKPVSILFLLSPLLLAAFLVAFGFIANRQYRKTLITHGEERVTTIGQSVAIDFNSWLEERYSDGNLFSRNRYFCQLANDFLYENPVPLAKERLLGWIKILEDNLNYDRVVLLDSTGRVRLSSSGNLQDSAFLYNGSRNFSIPRIRFGPLKAGPDSLGQEFKLFLLVPLYKSPDSSEKIGYLSSVVDTRNNLSTILGRYVGFVNSLNSFLVYQSDEQVVVIRRITNDSLVAYNMDLASNPVFMDQLNHLSQPVFINTLGEKRLNYFHRIEGTSWIAGVSLAEKEILFEMRSRNLLFILVLSLLFVISCLVLLALYNLSKRNLITKELETAKLKEESSRLYRDLFFNSPVPMWIYRLSDLRFLEVNEAAIQHYGYSREEFLNMDLRDLRSEEEGQKLMDHMREHRDSYQNSGIWKHKLKSGKVIEVEITSHLIDYQGYESSFVMAYDVTERETELKDLWDNAPVGYHSLDPEGNIIRINQTELNWLGYKAEELVNKAHVTKIMTPESQETFKRNFTIFKERGWIKDVEFEFLKKDGTRVPVLVSATAVFNPDGTYHHARSTVVDDTFLRAARVDREQKYRMLMENSFDVIFLLNMDLRYTYVSPAVEKLRGYSVAEVMNQTMDQVMTPESAQAAYLAFVEQMKILEENPSARPEPGMVDVELLCKDGSTVWTEIKSGFIYGTDGRPVGVMGIIRDISERRQMTNELINARDRAEVSEKLKSAFLANMSHEIRTPLNAIVGFSSLLDETDSPSERKQFVELINHGSDQLLQILDDILDISRIEAKQLNVRPELVNLPEIFSNLEKQSLIALSSKKPGSINLKCSIIKENLPETIFVDPIRLVRVMNNLIDNAIKFTGQGEIVFGYQPCGNPRFIRFFVKDTGIGIRKDQLDVIFERFRQGENSLSRKFGGTGLGLAISRSMVELMGGTLQVESEEGMGSEFWFTLPV